MDGSIRRTRFEAKVNLEREFLSRVNAAFGREVPLAGMTRKAIDVWAERAVPRFAGVDIRGIAALLIEASTRADLLADNSRDVFEPDRRPKANSIEELRDLLDSALNAALKVG